MATWGYGSCCGPEKWPSSFPLAGGQHQSPINIVTNQAERDTFLELNKLKITIDSNKFQDQILHFTGHNFKVEGNSESMSIGGGPITNLDVYKFAQLHFHWGNSEKVPGSEHEIDGQRYPSELHMVHYNSTKYPNIADAASHANGLLVLGIFVNIGEKNVELEKLMKPLSSIRSLKNANLSVEHAVLDLKNLLPKNTDRYYTYPGSLTTPPCYESVTWIVFEEPITMSDDQLLQFRWVHLGDDCGTTENFRPVCALNDRKVKKSFN